MRPYAALVKDSQRSRYAAVRAVRGQQVQLYIATQFYLCRSPYIWVTTNFYKVKRWPRMYSMTLWTL